MICEHKKTGHCTGKDVKMVQMKDKIASRGRGNVYTGKVLAMCYGCRSLENGQFKFTTKRKYEMSVLTNFDDIGEKSYYIRAQDRITGKRVRISDLMTKSEASHWKASSIDKKSYKYFRPVKLKI